MSGYDEMERAVADMRERFLAIGESIARLLVTLTHQIDVAPTQARTSLRQAAQQIAATQLRLRAQVDRLPRRQEERYQIMSSLLQAQHGALQQLGIIVEQNAPQDTYAPTPWAHASTEALFGRSMQDEQPVRALAKKGGAARRPRGPAHRSGMGLVQIVSLRGLALLAVMAAALCAYLVFPIGEVPSDENRGRLVASADDAPTNERADTPDSTDRKLPPGIVVTLPSIGAKRPPDEDAGPSLLPRPTGPARIQPFPPPDQEDTVAPVKAPVPTPILGGRQVRGPTPGEEEASTALKPPAPAAASEAAPVEPVPLRFVAVVFTHKERGGALGAFGDLQQRFPSVLGQRKAEAQPIEIADKGTWHRLVVLPAGSRQNAAGLCDQLQTAGYDRCWVKAY